MNDIVLSFGLMGKRIKSYGELGPVPHTSQIELTVAIPNMNRSHYLKQLLDCIEDQDYPKQCLEIIIVDDASTDGSQDLIRKICKETELKMKCIFLTHTRTYSPGHPWNVATQHARGPIIVFLQPDLILAQRYYLEAIWKHHSNHPNVYLSSMRRDYAIERDVEVDQYIYRKEYSKLLELSEPFRIDAHMIRTWGFYWPTTDGGSVRTDFLNKIRGFQENIIKDPPEIDLFCRLQRVGATFAVDPTINTIHRSHKGMFVRATDKKSTARFNPPDWVNKDGWAILNHEEMKSACFSKNY